MFQLTFFGILKIFRADYRQFQWHQNIYLVIHFLLTLGREIHQFIIFTYIAIQCKTSVHKTRKNNGERKHNKHASNTSHNLPGLIASVARFLDIWKRSGNMTLSVCFFIPSRFFLEYGDVTITGEAIQILTYDRHLWSFSSEDSLTFHT